MKNKRLYALILVAALALLQVRVAFAACATGAQASIDAMATCCGQQPSVDKPLQPMDRATVACAELCAQPYSAQAPNERAVLTAQFTTFTPSLSASVDPPSDARLHLSATAAHPPHTSLIYVLERLLI